MLSDCFHVSKVLVQYIMNPYGCIFCVQSALHGVARHAKSWFSKEGNAVLMKLVCVGARVFFRPYSFILCFPFVSLLFSSFPSKVQPRSAKASLQHSQRLSRLLTLSPKCYLRSPFPHFTSQFN